MILASSAASVSGAIRYSLDDFQGPKYKGDLSIIQANNQSYVKTGLGTDFEWGPLEVGVDTKFYIPTTQGAPYPSDFQFITVRNVAYNHNNQAGFKYGKISDVTYGYGLLMDEYNSSLGGDTSEFTFRKSGLKAYATYGGVRVDGLGTAGNVYGARVSYDLPGITLLDVPVKVGATYVNDTDGLNDVVDSSQVVRSAQSGYGVDIGLPLAGEFLTLYAEYSKLTDQGQGAASGIKGNFLDLVKYRAEFRVLGSKFVPGYFNTTYEATSFDFDTDAPTARINGFLGSLSVGNPAFSPYSAGLQLESYSDRQLLTAAVGWSRVMNTDGVVNYTVPFQNNGNGLLDASIFFTTGGVFDYVVNTKRVYFNSSMYTESYSVGLRFNADRVLPRFF
jgi:hypothetical protein